MASDDVDEFFDVLGSLQTLLLSGSDLESFLTELAKLACAVVEPPASCGITTRYDGRPFTIASSDERAERVDQAQYAAGDGPCLQALRTGQVVHVADQVSDQRWDGYRQAAVSAGVRWVLSSPLGVDGTPMGVLNLYGYAAPHPFEGEQRRKVEIFATRASTALALAVRDSQQRELTGQLEQALQSRSVIDQAIGVLMAQQRCTAETGFDLLRQQSQHSNRKLREVAAEIINRYTSHQPTEPAPFQRRGNGM